MRPFSFVTGFLLSSFLLAGGVLATGCAPATAAANPDGGDPGDTNPVTFEFQTPSLTAVSPSQAALGDQVKVFGKNFIDPDHGTLTLHMTGSFTDTGGVQSRWTGDMPLTYVSPGQATFEFGPDVFFSPDGQTIGTYDGTFQVVSTLSSDAVNASAGDTEISNAQNLELVAAPSVYVEQLRSVDSNCEPITKATTGGQNIALGMKLLGMADATDNDPITYSITYDSASVTVAYVGNQLYGSWPFWGPTTPKANASTNDGQSTFTIPITSGTELQIDPQHYQQVVSVTPPVMINQMNVNNAMLAGFASPIVTAPGQQTMTIYVRASRNDGTTITRTVNLAVWNAVGLPTNVPPKTVKEYLAPELADVGAVYGSVPNGTDQAYHEGSQETKSQSINMSWNVTNAQMLGISDTFGASFGIPALASANNSVTIMGNQTWSQTFGTDVSKQISATLDTGTSISQHILPTQWGAIYLQWARYEARADVTYHSACGVSGVVGQAVLTTWTANYVPETGNTDPPPPKDCKPAGPVGGP